VSQSRRRPPPRRPVQKRRPTATTNRTQRIYAIFGVFIVFALIATIVGPPLVDYITQSDDDPGITVNENSEDPVEADYLARIEADPNNASAMSGLGSYLGSIGRVDEAIPWYERALEIAPDNVQIRFGFGNALANGEKRADAELQFKKVIETEPNNDQAHFALAQLYANWVPPRTADAIAEYQTVIAIAPDTFVAERSKEELSALGVATPSAASPVASPAAMEAGQ
jgi:tetratricopeptide (TPR) repeat protein